MHGLFKSKLVMALAAFVMIAAAIIIPLAGSILHSHSAHAQASTWTATGNILLPRYSFQATTLNNGKVLIEGGFAPGSYTTDSELFDPTTGVWTETGSLNQGRGEHSATLLQDGRVLVAGGYAGPVLNSAEIYDPATGAWTLTGSMNQVRTRHTATLLPNGKVLVAGGWNGDVISGAELYDPTSGSWSSAGNMLIPRAGQVAVLLQNGNVLIAGGATLNNQLTTESELYDPNTNTWTQTGSLNVVTGGTGVLLHNGKVLMAGDGTANAELYDPATGAWTLTESMQHARSAGLGMQALLLTDGTVLIAGGDSAGTSEVYDPSTGTWGSLTNMVTPQCGGATALLAGQPLIAGGTDCTSPDNKIVTTELYQSTSTSTPPSITVNPTQGTPSTAITVTGSSWTSGDVIDISLSTSVSVLTKATVANDGTFSASFTVPNNAATGSQFVTAKDETTGQTAQASFTVTSPPRGKLFILLQGIDTSLSASQIQANTTPSFDNIKTAILASVSDAQFLNFSYMGPVSKTDDTPQQYDCSSTLENPLSVDIQLLGIQIQAALLKNPNTDIYLVGHSLGGVVAYGYLAALTETTGIVTPLPSGAQLKGVITLDSPLGGISSNNKYLTNAETYFEVNCPGYNSALPSALLNLSTIFDSTSKSTPPDSNAPDPQGAQASILSVPFSKVKIHKPFPSNQQAAEDAQLKGTSVLTIGNDHDLLWRPSACFSKVQDFISTQWLEDEGSSSQIYAGVFTSGDLSCFFGGLLSNANHFDVLSDRGVLAGISTFLPNGATPGLLVAPPGPD